MKKRLYDAKGLSKKFLEILKVNVDVPLLLSKLWSVFESEALNLKKMGVIEGNSAPILYLTVAITSLHFLLHVGNILSNPAATSNLIFNESSLNACIYDCALNKKAKVNLKDNLFIKTIDPQSESMLFSERSLKIYYSY